MATRRRRTQVYFGGASGVLGIQPERPPSLAAAYIPLDTMSAYGQKEVFGLWLGKYLNSADDYEFVEGFPASEDPLLWFTFRREYEAGGWRKLGRGLTLQEMALMLESTLGQAFMALVNSHGPDLPTPRVKRKLGLDADAILELVATTYALRGNERRQPLVTMFYDGKTGHCISLLDTNPTGERFAYHDPWPGRSLLCTENNAAGIAAESLGTSRLHYPDGTAEIPVWSVTREELARVLVATFVDLRPNWSALMLCMVSGSFSPHLRKQLMAALETQANAHG